MNQTDFDALMVKLNTATWAGSNLTSNTKIFYTTVSGVPIVLYEMSNLTDSVDHRPNLYINGSAPELTEGQLEVLNTFGETILSSFSTEIQEAFDFQAQKLENDLQKIIS
jgi:hypothetical protein